MLRESAPWFEIRRVPVTYKWVVAGGLLDAIVVVNEESTVHETLAGCGQA